MLQEISHLWIEMDSALLVHILQEISDIPWNIYYMVMNIKRLAKSFVSVQISHIFCEGNHVADILAKWEVEHQGK